MLATRDRQKLLVLSRQCPPDYYGLHATDAGGVQPTPLITRLRPQEGSESGQLSARGFEPTQTPSAALQADVLTIVPKQPHPHPGWSRGKSKPPTLPQPLVTVPPQHKGKHQNGSVGPEV